MSKSATFSKTYPGADALKAYFSQHGISQVEVMFADISGYPRGKLTPAHSFAAQSELRIAEAIMMQAVTGEYSYDPIFPDCDPDVKIVPDYSTLCLSPWSTAPRAMVVADCQYLAGGECGFSSRGLLKQVVEKYTAKGLKAVVAPEIEFYLTAPNVDPTQPLTYPAAKNGRSEAGQSAYSMNMLNELAAFWDEFRAALDTLGVVTDTWIHEAGRSQYEINLMHGDPVAVADQAFLFKYAAKEIAIKHGLNAVFMAKPISGQPGSSMHLHQSVVDAAGQNIFSNPNGTESVVFRQFIAGLQTYIPDMMLIFAPFINSYRRFVEGSQAPVNLQWGLDNRTTGLRIPISGPAARRVENRIAGADANPYLAIAASLAAGLAGMEEGLVASAPIEGNGYDHAHDLASGYQAAHAQMKASATCRRLLSEKFVEGYVSTKWLEYQNFQNEISAWERRFLVPQA